MTNPTGATPAEFHRFAGVPKATGGPHFAASQSAEYEHGVLYEGPWETEFDGTARAVRLHARALRAAGIPVLLESRNRSVVTREGVSVPAHEHDFPPAFIGPLRPLTSARIGTLQWRILHALPTHWEQVHRLVVSSRADAVLHGRPLEEINTLHRALYGRAILFTVFERDSFDPMLVRVLQRFAEIWVPCVECQEILQRSGVERVVVMPHPIDPDSPLPMLRGSGPTSGRHFLSIGKWEPRKGLERLLHAFLLAFRPGDDVSLTIKSSDVRWEHYPSPERALEQAMSDPRVQAAGWRMDSLPIQVILKQVSEAEVARLHLRANLYVSASHGEAWGLPAADGVLAGRRLVHVPWGGTRDFAPEGSVEVPFELGPVDPEYRWGSARWAEYRVEDLADALARAEPAVDRPHALSSLEQIGERMRERILALSDEAAPAAAVAFRVRR